MIKIIGRFMIILLVACLVAGGLYWLVKANPSLIGLTDGGQGLHNDQLRGQGLRDLPGAGEGLEIRPHREIEGGGGEHNRLSGSLDARAISAILRNLLIIAATTLAVLGIQKVIAVTKRRRQNGQISLSSS